MMTNKSLRDFLMPIILIAIGFLGILAAYFIYLKSMHVDGPLKLQTNSEQKFTFSPQYNAKYFAGVSMDKDVAENLYPCNVNVSKFSKNCKSELPLNLSVKLSENGNVIYDQIYNSGNSAGGSYSSNQFIREIGRFELKQGKIYTLVVKLNGDATPLQSAHPHLVVRVDPFVLESEMVLRFLIILGFSGLVMIGLIWGLIRFLLQKKPKLSSS